MISQKLSPKVVVTVTTNDIKSYAWHGPSTKPERPRQLGVMA